RSFHGRTYGALTITGQPKYHEGMGPLLGGVRTVPYGDLDAMRAVVGKSTAAVIVEPLQAEGGLVVPPPGYLAGLRELCDQSGALLLFDEVQTGYGRLGSFLASELFGVRDRKSTRLNSSHVKISYAVFCSKKKKNIQLM